MKTFRLFVGRLLAHEWLRYRYGVFEEVGQVGNPLHPPHYRAPDSTWKPNACSNQPLVTDESCNPGDLGCDLQISQQNNPGLKSSFMAFPEVPSVSTIIIYLINDFTFSFINVVVIAFNLQIFYI